MKYKSVFDIIGPVMIGPSSSHTAGAVRIAFLARRMFGKKPDRVDVSFFGSFAQTYKGHATDVAVAAGILEFSPEDPRIKDSIQIAEKMGTEINFIAEEAIPDHPNTLRINLIKGEEEMNVTGISVGGGAIQITEIDGFDLKLSGENPAVLVFHKDAYGTIAPMANIMSANKLNIAHMEVSRREKGSIALMVIETDESITPEVVETIEKSVNVTKVIMLEE